MWLEGYLDGAFRGALGGGNLGRNGLARRVGRARRANGRSAWSELFHELRDAKIELLPRCVAALEPRTLRCGAFVGQSHEGAPSLRLRRRGRKAMHPSRAFEIFLCR